MGASQFCIVFGGDSMVKAFHAAKEDAYHMHGHGGYTGTIAEKPGFTHMDLPEGVDAYEAEQLLQLWDMEDRDGLEEAYRAWVEKAYEIWNNKWGPALCLRTGDKQWMFCGMASS